MFEHSYEDVISLESLLEGWQEFVKGKRSRPDVQLFERKLMENLLALHESLAAMSYKHSPYTAFTVSDPKTRQIHKASVADRVLHRALYRKLHPFFDRQFIADSFSCRLDKGTHKALDRFEHFSREVTRNYHKTAWVLKCDVRKFFASIDQQILLSILDRFIIDKRIIWLLERVVRSFSSEVSGVGLPLGNLTSQIFANVYLNVFDQFVKHVLRVRHYVRYADDFVLLSRNRRYLVQLLLIIGDFLERELHLRLHPNKIELRTVASGIDFLGWVHFPHHRVLRTTTKRRMIRAAGEGASVQTLASYRGLLKHGDGYRLLDLLDQDEGSAHFTVISSVKFL